MNSKPNQAKDFLIAQMAVGTEYVLSPLWYAARSHMGIQYTSLTPLIVSGVCCSAAFSLLSLQSLVSGSVVNARVAVIYALLVIVGFIRNTMQAKHRRRVRDWSVNTWSTGESLLGPVLLFMCRRLHRAWGHEPRCRRLVETVLRGDFIYYVAEPVMLVLVGGALWSIGSTLYWYVLFLACALITARNDAQLWVYLKAHEIPDGKMLEQEIKSELAPVGSRNGIGIPLAQIPPAPANRAATDDQSVFDRLSPDLQMLLARDRTTQP